MSAEIERPWKRTLRIVAWLYIFPPVGLWKLFKDPTLTGTQRGRILIYGVVIPLLLYTAVSLWSMNRLLARLVP